MAKRKGLSQREVAGRFGLTARQVHNLVEKGMPRTGANGTYIWSECFKWYLEFKQPRVAELLGEKKARLMIEKLEAETRIARVAAADAEGRVITLEMHEQRFASACDRLRAVLINIRTRYRSRIQQARTRAEADDLAETIMQETFRSLLDSAADLEADGATGESGDA